MNDNSHDPVANMPVWRRVLCVALGVPLVGGGAALLYNHLMYVMDAPNASVSIRLSLAAGTLIFAGMVLLSGELVSLGRRLY